MDLYKCFIITFLSITQYVNGDTDTDPVVEISQGFVRGLRATDGNYSMFLGIPFAKVDENNPFGASVPHPKFETTFDAVNDSAICPQFNGRTQTAIGSIDCLHLNVFVPNSASSQNRLPVFVYIYGGRFQMGAFGRDSFGPQFLVRHDIILVTFNYRVGPYGFFCLDTPEIPGNAGLKDQLMALRWVKENIAAFGGDVSKITLGGMSAGGVSAEFHFLYNKEIYFHQVIMQSGTAHCPWAIIDANRNEPIQLAELLGYSTTDLREAVSFLSRTDPVLVISAKNRLGTVSRACVEKTFDGVESFITDYPYNMRIPRARTTPILAGYTTDEMTFEYLRWPMEYFENPNLFADDISMTFEFGDKLHEMGRFYKTFYVGETMGEESQLKIIDFQSDLRFNHPTQRTIDAYLNNDGENVYHYLFTFIGGRNAMRVANNITIGGATHGDENGYLFDMASLRGIMSPRDQVIVDRMTTMWSNFVKYGNPTPTETELLPITWRLSTNSSLNYLEIDWELSMSTRPFHKRLTFWDYFYDVNRQYLKGYRGLN